MECSIELLDFLNGYSSVSVIRTVLYAHNLPSIFFFFKRSYVSNKKLLRIAQKTMLCLRSAP